MKSNRLRLHTPSSSATVNWGKYQTKDYLHFDIPLNIERVKHFIENPDWIKSHAFLPFIRFDLVFNKYVTKHSSDVENDDSLGNSTKIKEKKQKTRSIMYASHLDQFIYKYYGERLNNYYNEFARKQGIDKSVLAYRNNKKGKNNLHFAAEVFKFILNSKEAIIISLDFSSFFDNINHKQLKNNIKVILDTDEIPADLYNVFKNTTKYSFVNKLDIDRFLLDKYGKKELAELRKNNKLKKIMSNSEFRNFKRTNLYKNKKPYGIPQGSGMSAVCSNIHLIHFDQDMVKLANSLNGMYRRYSDDLILIIPTKTNKKNIYEYRNKVFSIVDRYKNHGLIVQEEKTEIRFYKNNQIFDENGENSKLDYLGLVMDGKKVQIREKSVFKYYSRAYRKAKVCKKITEKTGKKYERRKLYKIYTHLGSNYKGFGNFTTYAKKADQIMRNIGLESNIHNQVKRHWNKIQKRLN